MEIVYGPVPSRRLGHSLGINNIPPKTCSYSCIYCQIGRTTAKSIEPKAIYKPAEIAEQVRTRLQQARDKCTPVDYVTFVADGEPTLDAGLGAEIDAMKTLGVSVAVISNGSLLWHEDVRRSLHNADWVSLKVDAVSQKVWRKINKPHRSLIIDDVLHGMIDFARDFRGQLATETMLIKGINDNTDEVKRIADFINLLRPDKAYVAIPIRPPAEKVMPADEQAINAAFQILEQRLGSAVEYLIGYEGNDFACTGNARDDILSITSVHPMRKEALCELLTKDDSDWSIVHDMLNKDELIELQYLENTFYMRKLHTRSA